ncbi:MAG: NVEALA domain-containing protein [Prevotellaceae bacterium]|jgi:hypothetical protein|nr:NVEALA domain-containing protein [Prevotellaceae bacterium]
MNKRKFLSFKPIAGTILGLAFATITGVNVYLVMEGQKKLSTSDVMLKNIEALSQESNNQTQLWIRMPHPCSYTVTGNPCSTIVVTVGGMEVQVQLDKNGNGTVTNNQGRITCDPNGTEQCTAKECL